MVTQNPMLVEEHSAAHQVPESHRVRGPACSSIPAAERVRQCLERREAVQAAEIAHRLSMDADAVRLELDRFVALGLAEVIRPVGPPRGRDLHELEYFRWIRQTDGDYLWQKRLLRHDPARPALAHEAADARSLINI